MHPALYIFGGAAILLGGLLTSKPKEEKKPEPKGIADTLAGAQQIHNHIHLPATLKGNDDENIPTPGNKTTATSDPARQASGEPKPVKQGKGDAGGTDNTAEPSEDKKQNTKDDKEN